MERLKRKIYIFCTYMLIFASMFNISSRAEIVNIEANSYFTQSKIPTGKTGKMMNITFTFTADKDYEKAWIGIAYDDQINASSDRENPEANAFPLEVTSETTERKYIGKIAKGKSKSVTLSARVRRDVPDGYYGIMVYASDAKEGGTQGPQEYVNIWISKSTTNESETPESVKSVRFSVGDGQATPYGEYPNVMNFSIPLKNSGKVTAYDVRAEMVLDKDSKVFPFDINDASYDRSFDKVANGESVSLDYSFSIRKDAYTGFYPIKLKISYRESVDGDIQSVEDEFYVHVKNKEEKESENTAKGDFNANDRSRSRIIVDSFRTEPEQIIAGEEFELIAVMKNASDSITASNILFSFESEKVSESPVLSTVSGANSIVVNSLGAGKTTEIRLRFKSKAGLDPKAYALTIKEKYDSPDFKNAEESVVINIPISQIARVGIGTITALPDTVSVGSDTSVNFSVNNTGKVTLYNTMVKLESSYIKPVDMYLGNIKAGESKVADMMVSVTGMSTEDEKIKITISYEDEEGKVSTMEKDMDLTIEEAAEDIPDDNMSDMEEPVKKPWYTNPLLWVIVVIIIGSTAGYVIFKKIKSKNSGDEI
mgnify:CR=1 FL=1|jgi:hypothetical protein